MTFTECLHEKTTTQLQIPNFMYKISKFHASYFRVTNMFLSLVSQSHLSALAECSLVNYSNSSIVFMGIPGKFFG